MGKLELREIKRDQERSREIKRNRERKRNY